VQAKFREFYPGDRIFVRDLRKEDTWWPGSVAERSGPRWCVVVLNDGRLWKRHVDHVRRDSMDRAVSDTRRQMESLDKLNSPIFHLLFHSAFVFQALHMRHQLVEQMYVVKWRQAKGRHRRKSQPSQ